MARILLLDDDQNTRQALAELLVSKHHDVRHAADPLTGRRQYDGVADGTAVVAGAPAWQPDVVLVELLRWQGNGFSLAATMARATGAPVLLLSDRGLRDDRHWARARGIHRVLDRSAKAGALLTAIAELSAGVEEAGSGEAGVGEAGVGEAGVGEAGVEEAGAREEGGEGERVEQAGTQQARQRAAASPPGRAKDMVSVRAWLC